MYLVEVYVTNASLNVNRPFTYCCDNEINKYCRVKVFFHKAPNLAIVSDCSYTDKDLKTLEEELGYKLGRVIQVIDEEPVISQELFELAFWLSRTTISPFISCLNSMLPKALKTSKSQKGPKMVRKIRKINGVYVLTKRQQEVYDSITDGMEASEARKISASIIKKLLDMKAIEEYSEEAVYENKEIDQTSFKKLTTEQQFAYDSILNNDKMVSLLFGVTGSGKTEVYLHLARHYLSLSKEVLILVPEISLTPQMIQRVKERFSDVIFYHSELSDQERYEQYKRVKNKEVKIVVGTRSSIFLPFSDLGLIILDEEHDQSYKQDNVPCYHARNVAFRRAIKHNAKVLLASATPSLDSYTRALKGDYQLLELKDRINHSFPKIGIIDLNKQLKNRDPYIISKPLKENISTCLEQHKQAIILLNRRGYSPIIKCADCASVLMCSDCDTPLNYHKDEKILKCHQCGKVYRMPDRCPGCGGKDLLFYGFGTKKVEEELKKLYPEANIERMDRDSVGKKGAHEDILKRFERHETDILIGTQMIAKGLDYPNVTLVGILNADAGLMHQDYNAAKMTFDLLMQASGRSGRANDPGKVLIQAFNTEHYALKAVINQDYNYFYNIEMNYRHKASYPPYSHIIEILLTDLDEARVIRSSEVLYEKIDKLEYRSYRPYELGRIKKQYRYRILLMDKDLLGMLKKLQEIINGYISLSNVSRVKIDVDPLYLE
ncbi:MAG: primosomal protein N' [Erysipelotrichaceae bacterium]|nr:primosomal protein N' [Erysipelotrichaceae bacterium]